MTNRVLPRFSRGHVTIMFSSRKSKYPMYLESHAEYAVALQLELDSSVDSFGSQPFTFEYAVNGKQRMYTPDFLVYRGGRKIYLEIKSAEFASSSSLIRHYDALIQMFAEQDLVLQLTFMDFNSIQVRNSKLLARYVSLDSSCLFTITKQYQGKIVDLQDHSSDWATLLSLVYAAMSQGKIFYDTSELISLDTEVQW